MYSQKSFILFCGKRFYLIVDRDKAKSSLISPTPSLSIRLYSSKKPFHLRFSDTRILVRSKYVKFLSGQIELTRRPQSVKKWEGCTTASFKFLNSFLEFSQNSNEERSLLCDPASNLQPVNLHDLTNWDELGDACWLPRSRDAPLLGFRGAISSTFTASCRKIANIFTTYLFPSLAK